MSSSSNNQANSGLMSLFQRQQVEQQAQPTGCWGRTVAMLPEEKNYSKAFMSFGICLLLLFISLVNIFSLVTNPASFVFLFTLAVIAGIVGLAQWNGPQAYVQKIFQKQFIVRTGVLFGSMFFGLWFSLVNQSYILSLACVVLEFNALLLFFCNTFPLGRGTIRKAKEQAVTHAVRAQVKSLF